MEWETNLDKFTDPSVLSSQDAAHMEIYRKRSEWKAEYFVAGQDFTLESVGLTLAIDDLYEFLLPSA